MDKKLNNKGFSLVEVIVVIAIIGILAVTMAPRLTQYLDKAKLASDHQVVNTIYTAAKLADISNPIPKNNIYQLGANDKTRIYEVSGKTWKLNSSATIPVFDTSFTAEITKTLESFTLKSNEAGTSNQIYIGKTDSGDLFVVLDYGNNNTADYIVPDYVSPDDIPTLLGSSSGSGTGTAE